MPSGYATHSLHDPRGPSFTGTPRASRHHYGVVQAASDYLRLLVRTFHDLPADVIAASLAINLLGLALPLAILQVYDRIIPNGATPTLLFLILCVCAALALEAILRITRSQVIAWSGMKEAWRTNLDAASRVALAPAKLVDREPAAYWMQRFQAVGTAAEFKLSPSLLALVDLPFTVIFLALLFAISPLLSVIPLVLFILFAAVAFERGRKLRTMTVDRALAEAKVRDFLLEVLNGIVTVKAFAMEQQALRRFERLAEQVSGCTHNLIQLSNDAQSLGSLVATLTQLATVTVGAVLTINGEITIGALACSTMLSGRLMQPLMRLVSAMNEIHSVMVASETTKPISDLPLVSPTKPPSAAKPRVPASVTFDNVTFRHEGQATPILAGADLSVKAGEIIAITGPNGCGRSTTAQLALGHLLPQSGEVLIDDTPVGRETAAHGTVAFVDHRVASVRGTILNNLTMFRDGEGIDTAAEVASRMGLEDEIHRLPRGYETRLGETATEALPPGLMQHLVVARAIASNPRLLILDQPNTSFDWRGDQMLARGLRSLKGKVTTILITNQPPLAAVADRVVTIAGGKFIQLTDGLAPPVSESANAIK